ncbi:MAG: LuxR C-terminal-related transcriptional regulator, partial [Candidatus Cryptobacteroides sp.]|nr:LuxR C-terminal-related transcriptional regulator [Candidatus Cryptobacteroides sp.]
FRSRWYQQGDRDEEAIRYFEQVQDSLDETDYLTASSLDDRLVRLYTRVGEPQKALESHDDYVFRMQKYILQKQDETLQEMETRFDLQEKERQLERRRYQVLLLVLALVLSALTILLVAGYLRKAHRRAVELQRLSDSKEQIIEFLSRDIRNPANTMAEEIATLSAAASSLSPEEIRQRCRDLAEQARVVNSDVADYVGNLLVDRSKKIADIGLSQREIQIIRLSAEGLKATEIADRIFLSVHTVNTHRQRIYSKMGVRNVSDMIRKATELGLI